MLASNMREVCFEGSIRKKFNIPEKVTLAGDNMATIISGLNLQFPGIKQFIREHSWQIFHNDVHGEGVAEDKVHALDGVKSIHIFPAVQGAGKTGNIILGIVLIVVGVIMLFGPGTQGFSLQAFAAGASMIASGAMMIVTALNTPRAQQERAAVDERASFMFNGAVNVIEQGGAVPLVYGRFRVGSTVVSAGIDTEELATYTAPIGSDQAPDTAFGIDEQAP